MCQVMTILRILLEQRLDFSFLSVFHYVTPYLALSILSPHDQLHNDILREDMNEIESFLPPTNVGQCFLLSGTGSVGLRMQACAMKQASLLATVENII